MIVREYDWPATEFEAFAEGAYHGGSVSSLDTSRTDERPRRPIGFRNEPKEPVVTDPSWMLL